MFSLSFSFSFFLIRALYMLVFVYYIIRCIPWPNAPNTQRIWWLQTKISGVFVYVRYTALCCCCCCYFCVILSHCCCYCHYGSVYHKRQTRTNVHINAGLSADVHCSHKKQIVCFTSFLWRLAWRHNFSFHFVVFVCALFFFIRIFIFLLIYSASISKFTTTCHSHFGAIDCKLCFPKIVVAVVICFFSALSIIIFWNTFLLNTHTHTHTILRIQYIHVYWKG